MASQARNKRGGGTHKDSAAKHTFNPTGHGERPSGNPTRDPEEQDPKRRIGQFGGAGEPPLMKK
jgi:hypothetical protein